MAFFLEGILRKCPPIPPQNKVRRILRGIKNCLDLSSKNNVPANGMLRMGNFWNWKNFWKGRIMNVLEP